MSVMQRFVYSGTVQKVAFKPGSYSLIWSIRGMCHWTGWIFVLSALNRVYNFVQFCPNYKQDIACTIDLIC